MWKCRFHTNCDAWSWLSILIFVFLCFCDGPGVTVKGDAPRLWTLLREGQIAEAVLLFVAQVIVFGAVAIIVGWVLQAIVVVIGRIILGPDMRKRLSNEE